ncbi:molybdopterin guanine dinucleotide-containing S/N-oxide reductase [Prescottella equi]|uniref:Molybdopterin guanine dinucleotide-containing S/N-oxide reductase n=1 Tax=Rhodococcus hoagii TaxID=43767 RepID=A0A9Q2UNH7_RHOHA|nr:molybdopterin guanine dinucleotide-containing S/N-oxide reductase [Prescottella equi]MBM4488249.1 molybdopterin guanine dinucleotide-containing S/N-oxide reductase [Prescottella equi]MBM4499430.1 molybdopterin guanine dinucleotide-containing S/N-oxide reductase [Prescottella equi]MBM4503195.1 molybdopterin guanine dinucleotide-containing S/N-oxide reductase [Prescottella equi]MBM4552782.1 molybdopterin guanine dinucleotide-containing S/N-oxide reductase [Prescottella equi]MBM4564680.1 molyb
MAHWGMFDVESADGDVSAVHPYAGDADPSPILGNLPGSVRHRARITGPAVRRGWLESGPGPSEVRGADEFVAVSWDELTELLARELRRIVERHGNRAIFGGSYGWASAGRFHHAQSQVHRFLNMLGGYTRSVHTYSLGATGVIMPRVVGTHWKLFARSTNWDVIAANTDLMVCFGGVPLKNTAVNGGGTSEHPTRGALDRLRDRGAEVVSISPLRDDLHGRCDWIAPVPGTDVPIMLGLAHVLASEGLHDKDFLARYCVGYDRFESYLLGVDDGVPKTPEWASALSGVPAEQIRTLARRMAAGRTMLTVTWSLQRVRYGEQAPWMGVTLAAMLGQIGLPGGGFGHGYGSMNEPGLAPVPYPLPTLFQGSNPVPDFIPVAAIADLLLHPGEEFDFDGRRLTFPDTRLVYWAGGNPFHHHQDLARLRRALARPDTIVVHEPYWTPMARHADIVVPSTTSLERNDLACTRNDPLLVAMHAAVPRYADARDDYDTFAALAHRLGFGERFTEGRTAQQWIEHLYEQWRGFVLTDPAHVEAPAFDEFWRRGFVRMRTEDGLSLFSDFRDDPERNPLTTPSGRIEIFSADIDGFGYDDCAGHPRWFEPDEWLGGPRAQRFPLHLIANQPRTRLHGQLDHGGTSQASKIRGREPIRLHPADAADRGLAAGEVVRVFNDRGACLAGVVLDDGVRRGVVQLSTGAWYDPLDPSDPNSMCVHGNPNVLTADVGSSRLAHGCTGQHVLVEVERFDGALPPIKAFEPPL